MKKFLKKYSAEVIITLAILLIVLINTRFINLFGSNTDWLNQHTIYPEYFRQMFYQTGKLLPNLALNYGAGENIFNFSYYGLLSPLILPSYLLPFLDMVTYMTIVNILAIIISAIMFYHFLRKHQYNYQISLTVALIFSLAHPLIFQMHRHIMFVNYMPFLVLAFEGVDKYFQNKKSTLLIISVFLMIMTSYYYSVCGILVLGIYYIYLYFENNKFNLKSFIKDLSKFILPFIIAIMLSAIILLPTAYTLLNGRSDSETTYSLIKLLTPNLKIYKLFCGTYDIGSTIIGFVALIYLFYSHKRNNIITASISSIILFIPIFCYLLNGGLYLREKCFIPFLPLICLFIAIFLKDLYNNKIILKPFIIRLSIIIALVYYYNQHQYFYIILIIFFILLYIFQKKKKSWLISGYLILTSLITCIVSALEEDMVSIDSYNRIFNKETTQTIQETLKSDSDIYRTNNLENATKTVNKIYTSNYYTTNLYSSTYNSDYLDFVRNQFKGNIIDYNYFLFSGTKNILFNSFMGVKYLYSEKDLGLGYTKIKDNLYQNNLALPIIYGNTTLSSLSNYKNSSYPYNLDYFLQSTIIDDENITTTPKNNIQKNSLDYTITTNIGVNITKEDNTYILKVDNQGYLKLKLKNPLHNKILFINLSGLEANSCSIDNITMTINNVGNLLTCRTWIYNNKNNNFNFILNDQDIETLDITLSKGTYKITDIKTYVLDYEDLTHITDNITKINNLNYQLDTFTGSINMKKDGYLVTSIPYDEGFTIKIDDQIVPKEKVNLAFLGTKLTKGYHTITITYQSPWLKTGLITSLIGLILLIITIIKEKYYVKNKKIISKI